MNNASKFMMSALVVGLLAGGKALANHEAGHEDAKAEKNGCGKDGCSAEMKKDHKAGGKDKMKKHEAAPAAKTDAPAEAPATPGH